MNQSHLDYVDFNCEIDLIFRSSPQLSSLTSSPPISTSSSSRVLCMFLWALWFVQTPPWVIQLSYQVHHTTQLSCQVHRNIWEFFAKFTTIIGCLVEFFICFTSLFGLFAYLTNISNLLNCLADLSLLPWKLVQFSLLLSNIVEFSFLLYNIVEFSTLLDNLSQFFTRSFFTQLYIDGKRGQKQ